MFIDWNKSRLKKMSAGVLTAALVIGAAAGFRAVFPGTAAKERGGQAVSQPAASEPVNWGLSFQQEGKRPAGNADPDELKTYNAFYCGSEKKKILYLTFDAGYENGYMEEILDVLQKEDVPAAFFVVGTYIRENPELIRRMEREGHIVGNHTMSHPDMSAIADKEAFAEELRQVEDLYKETTGKAMKKFYRPPQGKFSFTNLKQADELGYTTVFWSLAYVDWYADQQPTREEALEKLLPRTHNGAVILLHSTSKTNARILQELITRWKEEGYQFASLEKLGM